MTKFLGIEFAPVLIPLHRRLETLAVIHYVVVFLLVPPLCIFLPFYFVLFTSFWWVILLYMVWFYVDFETPSKGSRPKRWMRNSPMWRYFRDYFPVKLIKTKELDPNRNYIMGYHPHGVISVGMFTNFATEATGFSEMYPGITPHPCTLSGQFWFPFRREYVMSAGLWMTLAEWRTLVKIDSFLEDGKEETKKGKKEEALEERSAGKYPKNREVFRNMASEYYR